MPKIAESLAGNLRRLLSEKRISQTDLAKLLDVSIQTVNAYVNGRGRISPDTISKMAAALNVEETDLVADYQMEALGSMLKRALAISVQKGLVPLPGQGDVGREIWQPAKGEFIKHMLASMPSRTTLNQEDASHGALEEPLEFEKLLSLLAAFDNPKDRADAVRYAITAIVQFRSLLEASVPQDKGKNKKAR